MRIDSFNKIVNATDSRYAYYEEIKISLTHEELKWLHKALLADLSDPVADNMHTTFMALKEILV
jgi:hypothetical protein